MYNYCFNVFINILKYVIAYLLGITFNGIINYSINDFQFSNSYTIIFMILSTLLTSYFIFSIYKWNITWDKRNQQLLVLDKSKINIKGSLFSLFIFILVLIFYIFNSLSFDFFNYLIFNPLQIIANERFDMNLFTGKDQYHLFMFLLGTFMIFSKRILRIYFYIFSFYAFFSYLRAFSLYHYESKILFKVENSPNISFLLGITMLLVIATLFNSIFSYFQKYNFISDWYLNITYLLELKSLYLFLPSILPMIFFLLGLHVSSDQTNLLL